MMRGLVSCVVSSLAVAQDVFLAYPMMEQVEPATPSLGDWMIAGASPATKMLELTFAVKQQNVAKLEAELLAVSMPSSSRYGQHLSNDEVHALVAPRTEDIEIVLSFLASHGAVGKRLTPNGDMIGATVPVSLAETMLATRYKILQNAGTGKSIHRAPGGYKLPKEIAAVVDFVSPTVHIPAQSPPRKDDVAVGFGDSNTPKTLRSLYSVEDPNGNEVVGKAANNKMAVTAFLGQEYSQSDLQSWWKEYCTGITCGDGLPTLVGDATAGSPGIESMLDIETITGVVGGIKTEFWGFSGKSPDNAENEPFMKWLEQVAQTSDADVPLLFSTSYGENENSWSESAAQRLSSEFMKVGARGITLLFASGDSGANCADSHFRPNTPASSPWVTAVGATGPTSGFPAPGSEMAIGLSSGGFSNYFAMPDYQKSVVPGYLKQKNVPSDVSKYHVNTSGRAYPDIAAQGKDFCVTPGGCSVSGTSCSSPTVAGVIAALNDVRLSAGKKSLGFLNPLLYSLAGTNSFQDIDLGASKGCSWWPWSTDGWPSTEGWDAVTGLGTLNYKNLATVVVALQ